MRLLVFIYMVFGTTVLLLLLTQAFIKSSLLIIDLRLQHDGAKDRERYVT